MESLLTSIGWGVNDRILEAHFSWSYVSVNHSAQTASKVGRGILTAKVDIREAYRNIPVHTYD